MACARRAGNIRSGGDGGGPCPAKCAALSKRRLLYFPGLSKLATMAAHNISFDLPEFNGTLRVMAAAWSKNKVGHGTADIIVRDPVALLVSAPRFLTPRRYHTSAGSICTMSRARKPIINSASWRTNGDASQVLLDRTVQLDAR